MIINRFKPVGTTNFGDAINDYLWPKLLNPRFTQIPGMFHGIGTVLGARMPDAPRHVVFGSGTGYAGIPTLDSRWKVYFVRGPRTARDLGGVASITDPAILMRDYAPAREEPTFECSFMPRWDSIDDALIASCEGIGIHVIDARWPVEEVMQHIVDTDLLLTEALHGAVVADTLRVPWVSIYGNRGHEFKWQDWCWSMDMIWNPIDMAEFTLDWARRNAVPQLSALSILDRRYSDMQAALSTLNRDLEVM